MYFLKLLLIILLIENFEFNVNVNIKYICIECDVYV